MARAKAKSAKSKKQRGGERAGAGRPAAGEIPWKKVQEHAEDGAPEAEIIRGLAIPEAALQDPAVLARFRAAIDAGHGRYKLALRRSINRRGQRTTDKAGSVNALALQARNVLDWDKQLPTQEAEPDLTTARQRLRDILERLAKARTQVEGKPVTLVELLARLAMEDAKDEA